MSPRLDRHRRCVAASAGTGGRQEFVDTPRFVACPLQMLVDLSFRHSIRAQWLHELLGGFLLLLVYWRHVHRKQSKWQVLRRPETTDNQTRMFEPAMSQMDRQVSTDGTRASLEFWTAHNIRTSASLIDHVHRFFVTNCHDMRAGCNCQHVCFHT